MQNHKLQQNPSGVNHRVSFYFLLKNCFCGASLAFCMCYYYYYLFVKDNRDIDKLKKYTWCVVSENS